MYTVARESEGRVVSDRARARRPGFWAWPGLAVLGAIVAGVTLAPLRAVEITRGDGAGVDVPNPAAVGATSDAWDYLQLGWQVAAGRPFESLFTYPPFLPESRAAFSETGTFPLLWRPPGFPLAIGAALRLSGGHPDAMLGVQGLAIVVIPLLVFALAHRRVGVFAAAAAAAWTVLCPVVVGVGEPLVATPAAVALVLIGVLATSRAASRPGALLAGVVVGSAGLVRVELFLLTPVWLGLTAVASPRDRPLRALILVGAMALCAAPWSMHVATVTGRPFYNATSLLYHDTTAYPGWTASRTLAVREEGPLAFVREHPEDVARKTVRNLARYGRDLAIWPLPALIVLALAGVVRLWRDDEARWLVVAAVGVPATLVLVLAPLEYASRFLAAALPLIAVAAVAATRAWPPGRVRAVLIAITIVAVVRFGLHVTSATPARPAADAVTAIAALTGPPPGVVVSNVPTIVSCIWDVPSVWAPVPADLDTLGAIVGDAVAIFAPPIEGLDASLVQAYAARSGPEPIVSPSGAITVPIP